MFFFLYDRRNPSDHTGIAPQLITKKLTPYVQPDKSRAIEEPPIQLIQFVTWNTASSFLEPVPLRDPQTDVALASWARIDNRHELTKKLGFPAPQAAKISDSEMILHTYLKWEEDCVSHLVGDFAFALYDGRKHKVYCGRDHLGVRPLYYCLTHRLFVCATTLSALINLEEVPVRIDRQWIVDYLSHLSMSFDKTPYQGIMKLPPAHCLTITGETHRLREYSQLSDISPLRLDDSREYVDAYRNQLETAIKCRVETEYPLGSELSGGIDSSTVTAYAARLFSQPLSRFHTFGFAQAELDAKHILAVSRDLRLPQTHILSPSESGNETAGQRSLKILGYPVEHPNSTYHEPFYRLAETLGIRTLLSGFGGDEFATTIHGYLVPLELMVQHRYKELYQRLPGNGLARFLRLIKLGLKQIRTRNFIQPEYNRRFYEAYARRWERQVVRQEWLDRFNLKERFLDEARFDAGYTDLRKFTLEKRWMPFVPTRLENCTLMAAARKIEYRWPLLDVRLVRLFLSIPSEEHFYRGMGRYLHRRAIQGVVPDLVAWKATKDMGNLIRSDRTGEYLSQFPLDDIHPYLLELIDVEKLRAQHAAAARTGSTNRDTADIQSRQNLRAVANLDRWLKWLMPLGPRID